MSSTTPIAAILLSLLCLDCARAPRTTGGRATAPRFAEGTPAVPPTLPLGNDSGSNVRVNQDASGHDQVETTVAVNPTNPLNIVAGAIDYRGGTAKNGFYSTLDGGTTITLPPGTRSGQKLRLKGKGVPASGSRPAGDLYAVVQIVPPKKLDARSRELLEELARLEPDPT